MAITTAYLITNKNVKGLFDSLIGAKAPDYFNQKFLENLGFTSSNDRLYISVLKGLGFLDEGNVPTDAYFKFLDQSESKKVLAAAIEEAYFDLFTVNKNAHTLDVSEVKNKIRSITQGKHSEKVVSLMASTFKALCDYAEWDKEKNVPRKKIESFTSEAPEVKENPVQQEEPQLVISGGIKNKGNKSEFHYNIQIHLPESRDEAVYDAIFKSLTRHLF